jgi:hypothetical protein
MKEISNSYVQKYVVQTEAEANGLDLFQNPVISNQLSQRQNIPFDYAQFYPSNSFRLKNSEKLKGFYMKALYG